MAAYRTCIGCAYTGGKCDELDRVREQLSGLGVTSIKWRCKKRAARFEPGDAVWARTVVYSGDEGMEDFPGVFITAVGAKALVKIEPGAPARNADYAFEPKSSGFCKLPYGRLAERDGPKERVCRRCQEVGGRHADYCALSEDTRHAE